MSVRLSRRETLAGAGAVGLGALISACGGDSGSSAEVTTTDGDTATVKPRSNGNLAGLFDDTSACALTPEETEGPYYFDTDSIRSDIREDREGVALRLAIRVRDAACEPLRNAVVDIWHCDALGTYSGFEAASAGGPGGGFGSGPTDEEGYLRGAQVTDSDGIVEFTTIYPGWYTGRTVHIHAKVHVDTATVLTTQLYFDEEITAAVYEQEPYSSDTERDTFNDTDGVFDEQLLLDLSERDDGYLGLISFDVDST
jgi:protocatechuate 3,4-dioxygenase beta subunit